MHDPSILARRTEYSKQDHATPSPPRPRYQNKKLELLLPDLGRYGCIFLEGLSSGCTRRIPRESKTLLTQ